MCQFLALTLLVISQVRADDEFPIVEDGSEACPFDDAMFSDKDGKEGAIVTSSKDSILHYYPGSDGIKSESDCHDKAKEDTKAFFWSYDKGSKGEPAFASYAYGQLRLQV